MKPTFQIPVSRPAPIPTHLLFRLDADIYAIRLAEVGGVCLTDRPPVHFPYFHSIQRLDIRTLLHLPRREAGQETGLIFLSSHRLSFGVDSLEDTVALDPHCADSNGVVHRQGRAILLLDLPTLLRRNQSSERLEHAEVA